MKAIATLPLLAVLVAAPAAPRAAEDASQLHNPIPYSRSSIQRGRLLYVHHCPICHGRDGKALIELVANATDLTAPDRWRYGTSEGEIFTSLRDGAGIDMPPFAQEMEEQDLWHLVNYVRSLFPAAMRPQLAPDPPPGSEQGSAGASTEDGAHDGGGDATGPGDRAVEAGGRAPSGAQP